MPNRRRRRRWPNPSHRVSKDGSHSDPGPRRRGCLSERRRGSRPSPIPGLAHRPFDAPLQTNESLPLSTTAGPQLARRGRSLLRSVIAEAARRDRSTSPLRSGPHLNSPQARTLRLAEGSVRSLVGALTERRKVASTEAATLASTRGRPLQAWGSSPLAADAPSSVRQRTSGAAQRRRARRHLSDREFTETGMSKAAVRVTLVPARDCARRLATAARRRARLTRQPGRRQRPSERGGRHVRRVGLRATPAGAGPTSETSSRCCSRCRGGPPSSTGRQRLYRWCCSRRRCRRRCHTSSPQRSGPPTGMPARAGPAPMGLARCWSRKPL